MVRTSNFVVVNQVILPLAVLVLTCLPGPVIAQSTRAVRTLASTSPEAPHPLDPALKIARTSLRHMQANVPDYTAIMTKRCRVDGELSDHQRAYVKIRNRRVESGQVTTPMSVYMKFLKPDSVKGREVIWVEGQNDGNLVAHEGGLKNVLRVNLDPHGAIAMRGQRYPITKIGLENLIQQLIEKGERDRKHDECQVEFRKGAAVNKRICTMVEIIHPVERPYFDFHRVQLFFDDDLNVPIRYASWSWPTERSGEPVLEEEYTYTDVKVNVGLTDLDFDPDNSEYDYW